jgi:hypothetical protein
VPGTDRRDGAICAGRPIEPRVVALAPSAARSKYGPFETLVTESAGREAGAAFAREQVRNGGLIGLESFSFVMGWLNSGKARGRDRDSR